MEIGITMKYKEKLRMKRKLTLVLLMVLLVTSLFVSCKVETNEPGNGTVTLRFRADDDNSRSLNTSRTGFDSSEYIWYYTAKKSDSTPATGTKTTETIVGTAGKLNETVTEPFSLGYWDFTLYGYKDSKADGNLVYTGKVERYELKEDTTTIDMTVEPNETSSGIGTLIIYEDITLTADDATYSATNVTVQKLDSSGNDSGNPQSGTFAEGDARANLVFKNLASGSYKVVVQYKPDTIAFASNTIYVNIWDNLTTVVGGTLDETIVYERFNVSEGIVAATAPITSGSETTYTYNFTPTSTTGGESENTTTIKGDFTSTATDGQSATLTVTTYDAVASSSNTSAFKVNNSTDSVVAGIDITLEHAKFTDGSTAGITTYITKNLSGIKLYHHHVDSDKGLTTASEMTSVDTENDVDATGEYWYDSTTGKLVFVTDSFSAFFLSSTDEAINTSTNTAYSSLETAMTSASADDCVVLVNDSNLQAAGAYKIDKTITIDLNNRTWGIKPKDQWIEINGSNIIVTVKNGNIECDRNSESSGWTNSILMSQGTLSLENVVLTDTSDSSNGTINFMALSGTGTYLKVKDSELTTSGTGTVINIETIYNQTGSVEIENSGITATGGGNAIKAYSASPFITIKNSTLKATAEDSRAIVLNGQSKTKHTLDVTDSNIIADGIGIYCGESGSYVVDIKDSTISSTATDASEYDVEACGIVVAENKDGGSTSNSTSITLNNVKLTLADTEYGVGMSISGGVNNTVAVAGTLTDDSTTSIDVPSGSPEVYVTIKNVAYVSLYEGIISALKSNVSDIELVNKITTTEGTYPNNGDTYKTYAGQSVEWRVLDVDKTNKSLLLISEKVLPLPEGITHTTSDADTYSWAGSGIRTYLNGNFISEYSLTVIPESVTLKTETYGAFETLDEEDTEDQVFLLSIHEAMRNVGINYKDQDQEGWTSTTVTDGYMRGYEMVATDMNDGYVNWWLRSPCYWYGNGYDKYATYLGSGDFTTTPYSYGPDYANANKNEDKTGRTIGIRPAFWFKPSSTD